MRTSEDGSCLFMLRTIILFMSFFAIRSGLWISELWKAKKMGCGKIDFRVLADRVSDPRAAERGVNQRKQRSYQISRYIPTKERAVG